MVSTAADKTDFGNGYYEARIYVPGSTSKAYNFPAFWTNGQHPNDSWAKDGEIDIMESLGGELRWHYHWGEEPNNKSVASPDRKPDHFASAGGWHTYGMKRESGKLTFYYDGKEYGTVTSNVVSSPHYIILNHGLNADYASDTSISQIPATMEVDYVRFWKLGTPTNTSSPTPTTTSSPSPTATTITPSPTPTTPSPIPGTKENSPSPTPGTKQSSPSPTTSANTLSMPLKADTYVMQARPTSSNSSATSILVDNGDNAYNDNIMNAYLKFDLASLAGKTITNAKLRLNVTNPTTDVLNIMSVADTSWSEAITFNSKPAVGSRITSFTGSNRTGWEEINLTGVVQSKAGQLLSIEINNPDSNFDGYAFTSKEGGTPAQLIVTVSSTTKQ